MSKFKSSYRKGRENAPTNVMTVIDESRYLLVSNVPAYGNIEALISLFASIGEIEEYRLVDEDNDDPLVDIFWFKFKHISCSRFAKKKYHKSSFIGNIISVRYAPEYETVGDLRIKLNDRLDSISSRIMHNSGIKYTVYDLIPSDRIEITPVLENDKIPLPPECGEIIPYPPIG